MERRTCKRCMFYVPRPGGLVGRCRRHAPTMQGWPVMYPDSWCGDYKLNEMIQEKKQWNARSETGGCSNEEGLSGRTL